MVKELEEQLEYQSPGIGFIKAPLYGLAKDFYERFRTSALITRLPNLDHLGTLRTAFGGLHHSRWEYIMLQLYIISRLRKIPDSRLGLSNNNTPLSDGTKISGAEFLQMAAFLGSVGHMEGTYSSEKGLLLSLKENTQLCEAFKTGLPSSDILQEQFTHTLRENSLYKLKYFLAAFLIQRHHEKDPNLVQKCMDCIELMINTQASRHSYNPSVVNHLRLYDRIRKICYAFLDSFYGPVSVKLDLQSMLFDFDAYHESLASGPNHVFNRTLDQIEALLEDSLYFSEGALSAHAIQADRIYTSFREQNMITNSQLYERIIQKGTPTEGDDYSRFKSDVLRLPVKLPVRGHVPDENAIASLEQSLREHSGSSAKSVWFQNPSKTKGYLGTVFSNDITSKQKARTISNIITAIFKYLEEDGYIKRDRTLDEQSRMFGKFAYNLITYALHAFTSDCIFMPARTHDVFPAIVAKETATAIKLLLEARDLTHGNEHAFISKGELCVLADALKNQKHTGLIITTPARIEVISETDPDRPITDLDGLALLVQDRNLTMLFTEAKYQRRRSVSDSKRQLVKSLKEMGWQRESWEMSELANGAAAVISLAPAT